MKNPLDYLWEHCNIEYDKNGEEIVLSSVTAVCIAIEEAQKEAYNQAIDDIIKCDEDVVEWEDEEKYISVSAIKKLKK